MLTGLVSVLAFDFHDQVQIQHDFLDFPTVGRLLYPYLVHTHPIPTEIAGLTVRSTACQNCRILIASIGHLYIDNKQIVHILAPFSLDFHSIYHSLTLYFRPCILPSKASAT